MSCHTQRLLTNCLIQEVYWRIPPSLGPAELLAAAEKISQSSSCVEDEEQEDEEQGDEEQEDEEQGDEEQEDTNPTAHSTHEILEVERASPQHPRFLDSSSDEGWWT